MLFGLIALLLAGAAAAWLMVRIARSESGKDKRTVTALKLVVWLGLSAALFAAKLAPLAFMVLIAAAAVTAIETWREGAMAADERSGALDATPRKLMTLEEAAAVLGLAVDADSEKIKAAHRKLISQIHPDKGGTDYLAAKINEARDVMLAGLRRE